MNFVKKRTMIDEVLALAKELKLNNEQKESLLNLISNLDCITQKQKARFITYYGLNSSDNGKDYVTIAQSENCTVSSIRESVFSVRNKLLRLKDELNVIEEIYNNNKL